MSGLACIRPAVEDDLAAILGLMVSTPSLQARSENDLLSEDDVRRFVLGAVGLALVACDPELVGFLLADTRDAGLNGWACVSYIAVRPEMRRTGVGRRLLEAGARHLRACGVQTLYAWAKTGTGAEELMASAGFLSGGLYRYVEVQLGAADGLKGSP